MILARNLTTSLTILILVCGFSSCKIVNRKIGGNETAEAERAINNSPEFQEINSICQQIPLPKEFKLVGKARTFNSIGLSFYYYSENDFDSSDRFFRGYFTKNGWQFVDNNSVNRISEFRNEKYRVAIQYGGLGRGANYSIHCAKLSLAK